MLRPTELSLKLDLSKFEKANKILQNMYKKIVDYNKEVAKSNRLLSEQEALRKKLNISVKNGETKGLAEEKNNG